MESTHSQISSTRDSKWNQNNAPVGIKWEIASQFIDTRYSKEYFSILLCCNELISASRNGRTCSKKTMSVRTQKEIEFYFSMTFNFCECRGFDLGKAVSKVR